ncbi:MAG: FAD-binding protein [Lysobacteraceae bacterium]
MTDRFDAIVVRHPGLAGLAATAELTKAGKRVLLLDQEGEQNLGGQAFWSFGGLFFGGFARTAPHGREGFA